MCVGEREKRWYTSNMKKSTFILFGIFIIPSFANALFERDLYFGMKGNEVAVLQQFLTDQDLYSGPVNGNFFSLTQSAVKRFQEQEGINPAVGYFGPLTRAHANSAFVPVSREKQIADLEAKIAALKAEIAALLVKIAPPPPPAVVLLSPPPLESSVPPPPPPLSALITPPPPPAAVLEISGLQESNFPITEITPFKLGEITIRNGTANSVNFSLLELDIFEAMNSPLNRNNLTNLILRDGIATSDTLISKTEFTFNSADPLSGSAYNRRQINLSFPVTIAPGKTKVFGFWIENMKYVIAGSLRMEPFAFQMTSGAPVGTFKFTLTR